MLKAFRRNKSCFICCLVFPVVAVLLTFSVSIETSQAFDATLADDESIKSPTPDDHGEVLGLEKANCKKCHASEVAAWMKTKHYKTDDLLSGAKAKVYISKMGIDIANVRKNSICLDCHATKTSDTDGSSMSVDYGVSCSSCHGGSGGENGWLNQHQSFHETKTIPAEEEDPAHRKMRAEKCDKAGMIRPMNMYGLAKNCLSCHIISNQKLTASGHPAVSDKFNLLNWTSGEVRHNFKLDEKKNNVIPSLWAKRSGGTEEIRKRTKFLVGLLVDLEMCITNLSNVPADTGKSDFAIANAKRAKDRKELLEEVLEELDDKAPEKLEAFLEAVDSFKLKTRNFKDAAGAKKALPTIARLAKAISKNLDASKLSAIDEIISDSYEPRGKVFRPGQ